MATAESRRRDLYNGLTEFLGIERADTLMQFLPSIEGSQQATRSDIHGLSGGIDDVERNLTARIDNVEQSLTARIDNVEQSLTARFDNVERELTTRIDNVERELTTRIDNVERDLTARIDRFEHSVTARFDAMNQRLDRVVLTLAAGLMAIIATLVAQNLF